MAQDQSFADWMRRAPPMAVNPVVSPPAVQLPVRLPTSQYSDMYSGESGFESHLRRPTERQQVQEETTRNAPAVFNAPPPTMWQRTAPEFMGGAPAPAPVAPAKPTLAQALTPAAQDAPTSGGRSEGRQAFIPGLNMPMLLDIMRASRPAATVSPRDQAMHDYVGLARAQRNRRIQAAGPDEAKKVLAHEAFQTSLGTVLGVDAMKTNLAQRLVNQE